MNLSNPKSRFLFTAIVILAGFLVMGHASAQELPSFELPKIPAGTVEDIGMHFSISDSSYLNITLDSAETINLKMESIPEMVTMMMESVSDISSTQIILSGFQPNITYYLYQDDYHNLTEFTTDNNGTYSYTQDLTTPHLVFIQPRKSTKFIKDDATGGDCAKTPNPIGTWNAATKTCTLNIDLTETIQIDSNNITLDGNGRTIIGSNTGYGVYLFGRNGVTIKNLNVRQFTYGIYLYSSSGNILTGNTANSNNYIGIVLSSSNGNTLTGNTANSNNYYGIVLSSSNNNSLTNNTANSNNLGIYLYGSSNTLTGSTLTDNTANSNNYYGIYLYNSSNSTLTDNTANSNNYYGIVLYYGSNNTLTGNTAQENNYYDVFVGATSDSHCNNSITNTTGSGGRPIKYFNSAVNLSNETFSELILCNADGSNINNITIEGSTTKKNNGLFLILTDSSTIANVNSSNNYYGIYLSVSNNNILTGNTASGNYSGEYSSGIYLSSSNGNTLTGNTASNNNVGINLYHFNNNNILTGNTASNNDVGINIWVSKNNTLTGNTVSNNSGGIFLSYYSNNNILAGNTASNNYYGIYLDYSSNNNTLTGNTASNNYYGIYLNCGSNNQIYNCDSNNQIYKNNFISNSTQAYDVSGRSSNNIFNLAAPIGGNYWSNFDQPSEGCTDSNSDGFCDSPYIFTGGQDNLPWTKRDGWLMPKLPDVSINPDSISFFNDEGPFAPNTIKVSVEVSNKGGAVAENVSVNLFRDNTQIDTTELGKFDPAQKRIATFKIAADANLENSNIRIEALSNGQDDANNSDNTLTKPINFYFINFDHNEDAFWFENWGFDTYDEYRQELLDFLKAQWQEGDAPTFLAGAIGGSFFTLLGSGGHCYGMAGSSINYYLFPDIKPVNKITYAMEEAEAKPDIVERQWEYLLHLYPALIGAWEVFGAPYIYNATTEYASVEHYIKDLGKPIMLSLRDTEKKGGHAVVAYKILDLGADEKRVFVYDNNLPYDDPSDNHYPQFSKYEDNYVTFKPLSNQSSYSAAGLQFDMVFATEPWQLTGTEELNEILKEGVRSVFESLWQNSQVIFHAHSPVTPLIKDSFGRRIGYTDDNTFVSEIPGAKFIQQLDSHLFYLPSNLIYTATLLGTQEGFVGIDLIAPINNEKADIVIYENLPIEQKSIITVSWDAKDAISTTVLNDKDGNIVYQRDVKVMDSSDFIPPSSIKDLSVTAEKANSITLNWATTGDDWNAGTPTVYDLRYSTSPITETSWTLATPVNGEPMPRAAGAREIFTIDGLTPDATYYFAIKTADEVSNWSLISNVVSGRTKIQAVVSCDPDTLRLNSNGKWLTCYIELPEKYKAELIDIPTTEINETIKAVSDKKYGFVKNPEIADRDVNGLLELMVKFDMEAVKKILAVGRETILITGRVADGIGYAEFEGSDTILVK